MPHSHSKNKDSTRSHHHNKNSSTSKSSTYRSSSSHSITKKRSERRSRSSSSDSSSSSSNSNSSKSSREKNDSENSHKLNKEENHSTKAKETIRLALDNIDKGDQQQQVENQNTLFSKYGFNFASELYKDSDLLEERIHKIADDEDEIYIKSSSMSYQQRQKNPINDQKHELSIFGSKADEVQEKNHYQNQIWNEFKQTSIIYDKLMSAKTLGGPYLLEDTSIKQKRWKEKVRDIWRKRNGTNGIHMDVRN
ncbi:unnamed protein product [Didymodactylos carnosus]|uniref:Uncharacterized protein n=1 Tax=Didymodactylos carnosus TaxID=1234261 RepID=A0A814AX08_9BILA|nr:unnamed protein product [Didymodactylos carnosus]CAF0975393.1 unnamed protein product [Didymodactylos carnosus]CAF3697801.1 unnamed protein product [Didymodactylos carnosus]CAF3746191.1 unnamed protein product [Didymodactylos carnosus]